MTDQGGGCRTSLVWCSQFGRDDCQHCGRWRIFFENHVTDAGIPDTRQETGVFSGNYHEALRLRLEKHQIIRPFAIDNDYAPHSQVGLIGEDDIVRCVFLEQSGQQGRGPLILHG